MTIVCNILGCLLMAVSISKIFALNRQIGSQSSQLCTSCFKQVSSKNNEQTFEIKTTSLTTSVMLNPSKSGCINARNLIFDEFSFYLYLVTWLFWSNKLTWECWLNSKKECFLFANHIKIAYSRCHSILKA